MNPLVRESGIADSRSASLVVRIVKKRVFRKDRFRASDITFCTETHVKSHLLVGLTRSCIVAVRLAGKVTIQHERK